MSRQFRDEYFLSGQAYAEDEEHEWMHCGGGYYVCREGYVCRGKRVLKPRKGDIQGHLSVNMSINGKKHEEYIHRLVAKAFIPNPHNYPIVRHLDDNKDNNYVENLAWGTQKDNLDDMSRNNNRYFFSDDDREKHLIKQRKPVIAFSEKGKEHYFSSQTEAARKLGLCQTNINKVLKGERKHTGGYSFKFVGGE